MASGGEKRPRGERGGKQARKQKERWDRTVQGLRQPEASAKAFGNFICIWYFKSLALVFWKITFFWILGLDFIVLIW